uniref:Methyltransferase and helicase domain protein n=1 Tax=Grapevine leafroll-associated virus 1 TaxID=47985 RepID=A0A5A4DN53_9CLOS|nr:methyltransferase and helicase domain protein [Grapevine leafroll-associated virus 1]
MAVKPIFAQEDLISIQKDFRFPFVSTSTCLSICNLPLPPVEFQNGSRFIAPVRSSNGFLRKAIDYMVCCKNFGRTMKFDASSISSTHHIIVKAVYRNSYYRVASGKWVTLRAGTASGTVRLVNPSVVELESDQAGMFSLFIVRKRQAVVPEKAKAPPSPVQRAQVPRNAPVRPPPQPLQSAAVKMAVNGNTSHSHARFGKFFNEGGSFLRPTFLLRAGKLWDTVGKCFFTPKFCHKWLLSRDWSTGKRFVFCFVDGSMIAVPLEVIRYDMRVLWRRLPVGVFVALPHLLFRCEDTGALYYGDEYWCWLQLAVMNGNNLLAGTFESCINVRKLRRMLRFDVKLEKTCESNIFHVGKNPTVLLRDIDGSCFVGMAAKGGQQSLVASVSNALNQEDLFEGIVSTIANRLVLKEGSTLVTHLDEKISEMFMMKEDSLEKKNKCVVTVALNAGAKENLTRAFPELFITFLDSVSSSHGLCNAVRSCFNSLYASKYRGVPFVDIGGSVAYHVRNGDKDCHCCNPVMDYKDCRRREEECLRLATIEERVMTVESVLKSEAAKNISYCQMDTRVCEHKAPVGYMVDVYDLDVFELALALEKKEIKVFEMCMMFPIELTARDGSLTIPELDVEVMRKGDTILYTVGGVGDAYAHSVTKIISFFGSNVVQLPSGSAYSVEYVGYRLGYHQFSLCVIDTARASYNLTRKVSTTFKGHSLVMIPEITDGFLSFRQMYLESDFVDRVYSYLLNTTSAFVDRTFEYAVSCARSQKTHVIVGTRVVHDKVELSPEEQWGLVVALMIQAITDRKKAHVAHHSIEALRGSLWNCIILIVRKLCSSFVSGMNDYALTMLQALGSNLDVLIDQNFRFVRTVPATVTLHLVAETNPCFTDRSMLLDEGLMAYRLHLRNGTNIKVAKDLVREAHKVLRQIRANERAKAEKKGLEIEEKGISEEDILSFIQMKNLHVGLKGGAREHVLNQSAKGIFKSAVSKCSLGRGSSNWAKSFAETKIGENGYSVGKVFSKSPANGVAKFPVAATVASLVMSEDVSNGGAVEEIQPSWNALLTTSLSALRKRAEFVLRSKSSAFVMGGSLLLMVTVYAFRRQISQKVGDFARTIHKSMVRSKEKIVLGLGGLKLKFGKIRNEVVVSAKEKLHMTKVVAKAEVNLRFSAYVEELEYIYGDALNVQTVCLTAGAYISACYEKSAFLLLLAPKRFRYIASVGYGVAALKCVKDHENARALKLFSIGACMVLSGKKGVSRAASLQIVFPKRGDVYEGVTSFYRQRAERKNAGNARSNDGEGDAFEVTHDEAASDISNNEGCVKGESEFRDGESDDSSVDVTVEGSQRTARSHFDTASVNNESVDKDVNVVTTDDVLTHGKPKCAADKGKNVVNYDEEVRKQKELRKKSLEARGAQHGGLIPVVFREPKCGGYDEDSDDESLSNLSSSGSRKESGGASPSGCKLADGRCKVEVIQAEEEKPTAKNVDNLQVKEKASGKTEESSRPQNEKFRSVRTLVCSDIFDDKLRGRDVAFFSRYSKRYDYNGGSHVSKGWNNSLDELREELNLDESYDHCLIQKYKEGATIGFHADDEKCYTSGGSVVTVNLNGRARFKVRSNKTGKIEEHLLNDGDVFVMGPGMQRDYKHSVVCLDEGRVSITLRNATVDYQARGEAESKRKSSEVVSRSSLSRSAQKSKSSDKGLLGPVPSSGVSTSSEESEAVTSRHTSKSTINVAVETGCLDKDSWVLGEDPVLGIRSFNDVIYCKDLKAAGTEAPAIEYIMYLARKCFDLFIKLKRARDLVAKTDKRIGHKFPLAVYENLPGLRVYDANFKVVANAPEDGTTIFDLEYVFLVSTGTFVPGRNLQAVLSRQDAVLVCDDLLVFHDAMNLRGCVRLAKRAMVGEYMKDVRISAVNSPPGGGKTTRLVDEYFGRKKRAKIAAANTGSVADINSAIRVREGKKEPDLVAKTANSWIINSRPRPNSHVGLIDEVYMLHKGMFQLTVVSMGVKEVIAYGDKNQIPFINREKTFVTPNEAVEFAEEQIDYTDISYRCPADVCYVLSSMTDARGAKMYPNGVFPNGDARPLRSFEKVPIATPEDALLYEADVYLTMTQNEKVEMQRAVAKMEVAAGKKRPDVITTHEAQGKTYRDVVLVRLKKADDPIFSRKPHIVVALSRHTRSMKYAVLSSKMSDTISKLIDGTNAGKVSDVLLQQLQRNDRFRID